MKNYRLSDEQAQTVLIALDALIDATYHKAQNAKIDGRLDDYEALSQKLDSTRLLSSQIEETLLQGGDSIE